MKAKGRVRMAEAYAKTALSQRDIGARVRDVLLRELITAPAPRVLDIGCSTGEGTALLGGELMKLGGCAFGMDFDSGAINRADRRHPEICFLIGDMYDAPKKSEPLFDAIVSNEAWHWMPRPPAKFRTRGALHYSRIPVQERNAFSLWAKRAMRKSFSMLARRLKPGGTAVLQFGLQGQLSEVYRLLDEAALRAAPETRARAFFPTYYPKPSQLRAIVAAAEAGLRIKSFKRLREDLIERDGRQFMGFLRGFAEAHLREVGGSAAAEAIFREVARALNRDALIRLRRGAWHRALLVIQRR